MQRRPLRTRPINQATPPKELAIPVEEAEAYIEFFSNPRNGFCIGKGRVIIADDLSGQEISTSAAVSADIAMTEANTAPPMLIRPDGTEYVNPKGDIHTLTAGTCTHAHLVEGVPEDQWYDILTTMQPGEKVTPRNWGKTTNFAVNYGSSAKSISERNHIKVAVAEGWIKKHQETYHGYHKWCDEYGKIAAARGFAILPGGYETQRWVAEERSGGKDGDSAERAAVNFAIQGLASIQIKDAMIRLTTELEASGDKCLLIGQIHDELCFDAPGKSWVNWDECKIKNGVITEFKFGYDDEALYWALFTKTIMENVQTEMFERLGSPIKGKSSFAIAPVWAH